MDSLYEEVDWDTGPGWHIVPDPELSGVPPAVAEIVDLEQRRNPKRA